MIKHKIIFAFLIAFMTMLCFTGSALSQAPQLVARWPFDETAGNFTEDTVGDNDGELVGGPGWIAGKFGNAVQFDEKNGQYVEVEAAPELARTESLTVIAWVKVNSAAGRQEIVCYADSYDILINNGVFKAYIHQGGAFSRAASNVNVQTDKWYFLAMTYDDEDLKLYVDGKLEAEAGLPGGINILGLPLRFGNNPAAPAEPWGISGILDEVQLWDKPMTEDEIQQAYESPLAFLAVNSKGKLTTSWGELKNLH